MGEIAIFMKYGRTVTQRANGDQAINAGADRNRRSARLPVELDRVIENYPRQRALEQANVREGRGRNVEGRLIIDTLKHFLHHGQARHDLFSGYCRSESLSCPASQNLDPRARVDKDHPRRRLSPALACSRSATHSGIVTSPWVVSQASVS